MLTGEFNHNIDSKGRLIIPSKFRDDLGEKFMITKGMDGCLFVYPEDEWRHLEEKLRTLPLTNKKARDFKRFLLGSAVEGDLDKQGRVLISSALRTFAGLEKEVVLAGVLVLFVVLEDVLFVLEELLLLPGSFKVFPAYILFAFVM